jgi:hypothetical protein
VKGNKSFKYLFSTLHIKLAEVLDGLQRRSQDFNSGGAKQYLWWGSTIASVDLFLQFHYYNISTYNFLKIFGEALALLAPYVTTELMV